MAKRRWLDETTIVIPGRANADGTETPASYFRCEVETLKTGAKRVRSCVEIERPTRK